MDKTKFVPTYMTEDDILYLLDEKEHKYILDKMNGWNDELYRWVIQNVDFKLLKIMHKHGVQYTKQHLVEELDKMPIDFNPHANEMWEEPCVMIQVYVREVM